MTDRHSTHVVSIRAAESADVRLLLSLIRELAEYERLAHEVTATEESLSECLFGPRPAAEAMLAEVAGVAVGYVIYFTSFSSFTGRPGIYLEDVYVRPEHRGQGIGKQLLTHVAHLASERGCARIEWAVLNWNEPSIKFYESLLGARAMSDWTTYRLTPQSIAKIAASD